MKLLKRPVAVLLAVCMLNIPLVCFAQDTQPKSFTELNTNIQSALESGAAAQKKNTVQVLYSGDDNTNEGSISSDFTVFGKKKTSITGSDISATFDNKKFTLITLKDEDGTALSGLNLSVKLNDKVEKYKTDSKGQFKITTDGLLPKTYTAAITFDGNADYEKSSKSIKITVKKSTPKLIAKNKTFKAKAKTKKYSITIKNTKNQPIIHAKIYLKVNGKTYYVKTNTKGVATFKIKKLNKKGTYKAVAGVYVYADGRGYKKVSKTVKIKVK